MKKLFLLLLFVPLVSFGQNDNVKKKNVKETDIALNGAIITASMQKIKRKNKRKKMVMEVLEEKQMFMHTKKGKETRVYWAIMLFLLLKL